MAKRGQGEVSTDYILWTWRVNSTGEHPVKLRITHQRKKKYYQILTDSSRKVFLSKEGFEFLTSTPLAKLRKDNRALRDILDRAVDKAQVAIKDSTLGGKKPFSFAEFERKYLGADANRNFLVFFKKHIDRLLAKGQAGTARAYSSAYSALKEFYNNIDFDPADLTAERLHDFDEWLRTRKRNKKGTLVQLNDTSVSVYMRCIRAVYNEMAANDEYLETVYPFSRTDKDKKYKIPIGSGQKGQTLSKDELIAFINADKISGERIAENPMYRAKQLFLFSFFGQGCNFKDLALLRYENIRGNHIEFERQKTIRTKKGHSKIQIPLTDDLKSILVEQGHADKHPSNYVFNVFDPNISYTEKQKDDKIRQWVKITNKWLKRYCELNDLKIVSTYASRHTFASLAKLHLPVAMISKMLGHSRTSTTDNYLGRFSDGENRRGLMKVFKGIKKKSA